MILKPELLSRLNKKRMKHLRPRLPRSNLGHGGDCFISSRVPHPCVLCKGGTIRMSKARAFRSRRASPPRVNHPVSEPRLDIFS
jgi:hypothetical protein